MARNPNARATIPKSKPHASSGVTYQPDSWTPDSSSNTSAEETRAQPEAWTPGKN